MTGKVDKVRIISDSNYYWAYPPAQGCHIQNVGLNGPMASGEMSFETVDKQVTTSNFLSFKLPLSLQLCWAKNRIGV